MMTVGRHQGMRHAWLAAALAVVVLADPARGAGLPLHKCGHFQCGMLKVPLDYDDAAGPQIRLAVTKRPARSRKHRIGALFVNYGGPGADAVARTRGSGKKLFRNYRRRFDLVAVDPRGTGESRPALDCGVNQERAGIYRQPFTRPETFDESGEVARARRFADRCATRNAVLAPHVSTANVARDLDAVRDALGLKKINYFGFSYGTLLGATYAALFGDRVRAMVLDAALDPDAYLNDPMVHLRLQTAGFERALRRYFAACARARRYCRWPRRRSPPAAYDRLVERARVSAIPAPDRRLTRGDRRAVDGDDINAAVAFDLYDKRRWPELTRALEEAARGDASLFRAIADASYARRRSGGYRPLLDRYFTISASEQQYTRDLAPYFSTGAGSVMAAPHFYFNFGYSELNYGVYAPRDENAFLGPFTLPASGATPLVVGTTFDPATPFAESEGLVRALGNARLLKMRGDGHTAYGGNSRCIDRAVDAYVIRLRLPPAGRACRQHVSFPPPRRPRASMARVSALVPLRSRLAVAGPG